LVRDAVLQDHDIRDRLAAAKRDVPISTAVGAVEGIGEPLGDEQRAVGLELDNDIR
jgi:hypothetical protein